jgi:signal transduction histidine kinase
VIQETLNNIKMHAAADNVTIKMVYLSPNIVLQIIDDGQGFDLKRRLAKALRERPMELGSMETRISLLEGDIKIQSCLGAGTQIFIKVPCKEKQNGSEEKHSDYR